MGAEFAPTAGSGSPTGAAGGDLSGTYPNPTVGANKVTSDKVSLTTASAQLGADVTMTTAGTFYDAVSLSLAAGTWLVLAGIHVNNSSFQDEYTAKIWDGTTVFASAQGGRPATVLYSTSVHMSTIITLGSTTTIKLSAASDDNGSKIKAQTVLYAAGNNATWILAIRIA